VPDDAAALHLGWRARDYGAALVGLAQPLLHHDPPDAWEHPARPAGPPVVLVPGVYERWSFLRPLAVALHARGVRVHVVPNLGRNVHPIEVQAVVLAKYLERRDLRDVVLVAHSKGGLIGKLTMLARDPEGRVARMVAVNTPFDGSSLARWTVSPALRAFRPANATIRALRDELAVNERIVNVQSRWDPHVPGGSALPGALEVRLPTPGHFYPLGDPALQGVLGDVLDLPPIPA
jgi:hypothetical protein